MDHRIVMRTLLALALLLAAPLSTLAAMDDGYAGTLAVMAAWAGVALAVSMPLAVAGIGLRALAVGVAAAAMLGPGWVWAQAAACPDCYVPDIGTRVAVAWIFTGAIASVAAAAFAGALAGSTLGGAIRAWRRADPRRGRRSHAG